MAHPSVLGWVARRRVEDMDWNFDDLNVEQRQEMAAECRGRIVVGIVLLILGGLVGAYAAVNFDKHRFYETLSSPGENIESLPLELRIRLAIIVASILILMGLVKLIGGWNGLRKWSAKK